MLIGFEGLTKPPINQSNNQSIKSVFNYFKVDLIYARQQLLALKLA